MYELLMGEKISKGTRAVMSNLSRHLMISRNALNKYLSKKSPKGIYGL